MNTGGRTQTFRISGAMPFSPNFVVKSVGGRNLEKYQLGGVIFGCKNSTMKECQSKLLFGLPANHFSFVKNIDPGLPIFLFNYSDRKLHGIFEASSKGKMYIDPYAWIDDNSELDRTQYPAQVKVRVRLQCQPLSEDKFAAVIAGNYYTHNHFWFELDHRQANKLSSLLASLAFASGCNLKTKTVFPSFPFGKPDSETQHFTSSCKRTYSTEVTSSLDGDIRSLDTQAVVKEVNENDLNLVYEKLKEIALGHCSQAFSMSDNVNDTPDENDACTVENDENENDTPDENDVCTVEKEYLGVPEDQEKEEDSSTPQLKTMNIIIIWNNTWGAELKIQHLMDRCKILESASNLIQTQVEKTVIESHDERHVDPKETLFVKVLFDGESCLSSIDLYWSFQLVNKSLYPMNSTSTNYGSYNPTFNKWTLCPSLNPNKGSLTVVSLTKQIRSVADGVYGINSFVVIEVLDLEIGRWVSASSKLHK
ncbi:hypothetical protein PHAVU_010G064000, partial [Phaseolus vulgaris]